MAGRVLLIRADADERIGVGHAMRCLALAQAWLDAGNETVWLAAHALPETMLRRYEREGVRVREVGQGREAVAEAVRATNADWTVLDGYEFGVEEQLAVKEQGRRLIVVDDDGAAGQYIADIVVDPNVFADKDRYRTLANETRLLLGPSYALLRREILRVGVTVAPNERRRSVLVSFGGADPAGLSLVALEALGSTDLDVTLVVGPANASRGRVESAAASFNNVRVVWDAPDMRTLMDTADLALVAAGGTSLELAHLGVPQLVVVTAENQRRVAQALAERGVARSLGGAGGLGVADIYEAVVALAADPGARRAMRERGMALVDGLGAARVIACTREQVA